MTTNYTASQLALDPIPTVWMVAPMNDLDDLATLRQRCRQEREAFIKRGETSSPACVELFRRAFAGEEAAWEAIFY